MNPLVFLFADGTVLFIGAGLVAVCSMVLAWEGPARRWRGTILARILLLTGGVLVVLSATPFPGWLWGLAGVVFCLGCTVLLSRGRRYRGIAAGGLIVLSLVLAGMEAPWHRVRPLPFPPGRPVAVIGDSISAGTESSVPTWPEELSRFSGRTVHNFSVCGNTLAGALSSADRLDAVPDACVILEIGGNDLLRGDSAREFRRNLRRLLGKVCRANRPTAMFELPLPPFRNGIGRAQRALAVEFGVRLIPKRVLAGVLAAPGATLDGIHLSAKGHTLLARRVAALLPASDSGRNAGTTGTE